MSLFSFFLSFFLHLFSHLPLQLASLHGSRIRRYENFAVYLGARGTISIPIRFSAFADCCSAALASHASNLIRSVTATAARLPRLNVSRSSAESQFRFRRTLFTPSTNRPVVSCRLFRARGDLPTNHGVDRERESEAARLPPLPASPPHTRGNTAECQSEREREGGGRRVSESKLEPSLRQI